MKRICVFCGSNFGNKPDYELAAIAMGQELARRGLSLVYGGGKVGLMGAIADATLAAGGEVIGVIPEFLRLKELDHAHLTELHIVGSMHERKAKMAELADGFIAMPGGFGTFEEWFEVTAVRLKREQIQLVVDGDVVGTGVAARKGLLQGHLLEKSD